MNTSLLEDVHMYTSESHVYYLGTVEYTVYSALAVSLYVLQVLLVL